MIPIHEKKEKLNQNQNIKRYQIIQGLDYIHSQNSCLDLLKMIKNLK